MDLSKAVSLVPTQNGYYASDEHIRIANVIKDYDWTLDLVYVPADKRVSENLAFAVICEPPNAPAYIVFYAEQCDQRILERVFTYDNKQASVLEKLETEEAARKALKMREWAEANAEAADIGAHAMQSPLNWYRYHRPSDGKLITVRN